MPTEDSSPLASFEPLTPGEFCRGAELDELVSAVSSSLCPGEPDGTPSAESVPGDAPTGEAAPRGGETATSMVLMRGANGMGKSRLFVEARRAAEELGIRVREAFCYERQGIPFLPILRLVKELIGESGDRQALWRRYAHVLSRVFPELADDLGQDDTPIELPGEGGKIQFFDALTSIVSELSQDQPLLMMVHDLHRSDRGTVEFLEYLARNAHLEVIGRRREPVALTDGDEPRGWRDIRSREGRHGEYLGEGLPGGASAVDRRGCRWMVVANYRGGGDAVDPGSHAGPVIEAIDALEEEPFAIRIELAPLGEKEVSGIARHLLGGRGLPAEPSRRLAHVTGGNPLYVVEVCRAIQEGEEPSQLLDELEAGEEVDAGVEASAEETTTATAAPVRWREERTARLFLKRLGRLDASARAIVDVLAVLRRPTPAASLEEILDRDSTTLAAELAPLCTAGFVKSIELQGASRYFLSHEDHTRWTYEGLEDDRRRRLHSKVGHLLAEQERSSEPVRAFEIYEHLRRSETPREGLSFGLTAANYFARGYAGELAISILGELLPMLESDEDAPVRVDRLFELSRLEAEHEKFPISKTHIKQVIDIEDLPADRRVEAVLHLAEIYRRLDEPLKGIKALNRLPREVVVEAGGLSQPRISAMRARLRLQRQDPKRAISLCLRGLQELEPIIETETPGVADQRATLQEILADAHRGRGDMVQAIQGYQALLEQVEALGDDVQLARVLRILGRVYYDRGNHFRAARYLFRALEGISRSQDIRSLGNTYDLLGKVYRNSGDFLRSLEYFRRSLHLRERIGDKEGLSPTLNSIGSLYAHNGDYERAIRYFKRSLSNSERYVSTVGIVRAFLHLGWVYYDLGERKQVESLAKQILILAQEFNLSELEGEGHRLQGNLHFIRGAWKEAEREFRRALEISQRRGLGKLEAASHLDLGMLLAEREEVDGALKRVTKGLLLAEEIQAIPAQVRGHMLKGSIARQLKGGSADRALESYQRGLELVAGGTLLPLQFELELAMARTHQGNLDFEPARRCYERAERILEQISTGLPDDMRVVYHDDRRRRNFFDDLQRFKKEASGRPSTPLALPAGRSESGPPKSLPAPETAIVPNALAGLLSALEGLATARSVEEWARCLLAEARRLVPAPRGFLWESEGEEGRPLAQSDMGPKVEWASPSRLSVRLARAAIAEGRAMRSSEEGWEARLTSLAEDGLVRSRSLAIVPIVRPGVFRGALYLERPSAGNPFTEEELDQLEQLISLARGQLTALAEARQLRCFHGTPILTSVGFDAEIDGHLGGLREPGPGMGAIDVLVPGLDLLLRTRSDESVVRELIASLGPEEPTGVRLGGDHYLFLYPGIAVETLRSRRENIAAELTELRRRRGLPDDRAVTVHISHVDAEDQEAIEMLRIYGSQLFRRGGFTLDSEISQLTNAGLTLKEAKIALERRYITSELFKSGGNITRAAESLGVHRPQLSTLIKKHKVRREDFELGN